MDLNRILLVFNVSSVVFLWPALIVHTQTELGLNAYVAISDVRDGVAKTHTTVAETHTVVADTQVMVSEMHRQMLGSQGEADDQRRSVSSTRVMPTLNTCSPLPRIKPGQQTSLLLDPTSYICI